MNVIRRVIVIMGISVIVVIVRGAGVTAGRLLLGLGTVATRLRRG